MKTKKKAEISAEVVKLVSKPGKYFEAVGRRKTSIARVRIFPQDEGDFSVNGKTLDQYFGDKDLQTIAQDSLNAMNTSDKFRVSVVLKGGGLHSQAEAIRHGIARALVLFNSEFKKKLKKAGFLTRDPRMREKEVRFEESKKSATVAKTVKSIIHTMISGLSFTQPF